MDFTTITVQILQGLKDITGSYGLAIVFLTVIVRLVMWPLGVSQQKSMRKMQKLSPKIKEIQERYKSDPPTMQKKMMEFYKEHKFNPFGGCFPLLLQMPIFILLYTALISPQFIDIAGKSSFLFINRLDAPIKSHAGVTGDKIFGVEKNDVFSTGKTAVVYTDSGIVKDVRIKNTNKAVQKQTEIAPGKPLDLKISLDELDLPFSTLAKVKKATVSVTNNNTKEAESLSFNRQDSVLATTVETQEGKTTFNFDVIALVALFGITMFLSQKVMTSMSSNTAMDSAQKAMQDQMANIMPIMITATFIFIPIPAGVLLYMIVSNVIQVGQTMIINKQIEKEEAESKPKPLENKIPDDAKPIEAKTITTIAEESDESGKKKKSKKNKW